MNGDIQHRDVTVWLSRSNLQTLLDKLNGNPPNSARTLSRWIQDGDGSFELTVIAEEDHDHYTRQGRDTRGATWSDGARTQGQLIRVLDN